MPMCAECKWFTHNGFATGDNVGVCRAKSPAISPSDWDHGDDALGGRMRAVWPVVSGLQDSCGDYKILPPTP